MTDCEYFINGICYNGSECNYYHDKNKIFIYYDSDYHYNKTKICKYYKNIGYCNNVSCKKKHPFSELKGKWLWDRNFNCIDFEKTGVCNKKFNCLNKHDNGFYRNGRWVKKNYNKINLPGTIIEWDLKNNNLEIDIKKKNDVIYTIKKRKKDDNIKIISTIDKNIRINKRRNNLNDYDKRPIKIKKIDKQISRS